MFSGFHGEASATMKKRKISMKPTVPSANSRDASPISGASGGWWAPRFPLILLLFGLSGFSALVYETAWMRPLKVLFGATHEAISIVLTTYMIGLGLGGFWAGRRADREVESFGSRRATVRALRWYAGLEVIVGLFAFLFPLLIALVEWSYLGIHAVVGETEWAASGLRVIFVMGLLGVPTFAMGATLPFVVRASTDRVDKAGLYAGWLYGVNTLGATLGTVATGFWFIASLGVRATMMWAGVLNLLVALLAFGLSWMGSREESSGSEGGGASETGTHEVAEEGDEGASARCGVPVSILLTLFALAGFTNLGLEVLWNQMLAFFLVSHVWAFTAMLAVFLVGIGLGSTLVAPLTRIRALQAHGGRGLLLLVAALQGVLALFVWLGLGEGPTSFSVLPQILRDHQVTVGAAGFAWSLFLAAMVIMGIPTLCMGGVYPLLVAVATRQRKTLGQRIGGLALANSLAAAAGAFAGGYILLPAVGMQTGVTLLAILAGSTAALAILAACWDAKGLTPFGRKGLMAAMALVTATLLFTVRPEYPDLILRSPVFISTRPGDAGGSRLKARELIGPSRESLPFTVSVVRDFRTGEISLYTDNFLTASVSETSKYMAMLGHLPMLLHPDGAKKVCIICYGTGTTAGAVLTHHPEKIDLVEISPEVMAVADEFRGVNRGAHRAPECQVHIDDGRQFLLTAEDRYDVISLEPLLPHTPPAISFYTRDFYQLCRDRLAEGGIMCQWIPVHATERENYRILIRSFLDVFENTSLWFYEQSSVLIGRVSDRKVPLEEIVRRLEAPEVSGHLQSIWSPGNKGMKSAPPRASRLATLALSGYRMGPEALRRYVDGVEAMTDDWPILEFSEYVPVEALRYDPKGPMDQLFSRYLLGLLKDFARARPQVPPMVDYSGSGGSEANLRRAIEAETICLEGRMAQSEGRLRMAIEHFDRARQRYPDSIKAALLGDRARYAYHAAVAEQGLGSRGSLRQADRSAREVLRLRPDLGRGYQLLGNVQMARKEFVSAEENFRKALERNPYDYLSMANLGLLLNRTGRVEQGQEWIRKAMAIEPQLADQVENRKAGSSPED